MLLLMTEDRKAQPAEASGVTADAVHSSDGEIGAVHAGVSAPLPAPSPRQQHSDAGSSRRSPAKGVKTFSGTVNRAAIASVRPVTATAKGARNAQRRIRWDSMLRLRIFWLTVFFLWLGWVWGWRFQQFSRGPYRELFGPTLPFAKAAGNAMKMVIWPVLILPLSYVFTTSLRRTWIDRIIPFDDAITFHMMVAIIGGCMVVMHTICHIVDYTHAPHQSAEKWAAAFPHHPTPQSFGQLMNEESTYLGFGMIATLAVMFAFALPWPRKAPWLRKTAVGRVLNNYNWFWTTHKIGGGVFYLLLILHPLPGRANTVENPFAKNPAPSSYCVSDTWVWITLPIVIRLMDRSIRWWRRNEAGSKITGAEFMADGVMALEISRPAQFQFRPGMYLYLNIPAVAKYEWHPFSLAGAPSSASLSVLLRDSGDWASGLRAILAERLNAVELPAKGPLRAAYGDGADDSAEELLLQKRALEDLQLRIDGPFGAPAVAYRRFPVVLLVGAGIGVTPFLSMLADAVEQHAKRAAEAEQQGYCLRGLEMQKVHFHWLVREPTAPRWLRQVLETAAAADTFSLLDVNIHMTKAVSRSDSFLSLQEALGASQLGVSQTGASQTPLDLEAAEAGGAPVKAQQTSVKAWHGRPDFEKIFERLERDYAGRKVGVFYCGPKPLGSALSALALRFSARRRATFHMRSERF